MAETANPPIGEFNPAELQGGLLMQVENVHERLRAARTKHRVMVGNPFAETSTQTLGGAGVTVLGYDECQTVLTHPDTFSSSIYEQIMGPVSPSWRCGMRCARIAAWSVAPSRRRCAGSRQSPR